MHARNSKREVDILYPCRTGRQDAVRPDLRRILLVYWSDCDASAINCSDNSMRCESLCKVDAICPFQPVPFQPVPFHPVPFHPVPFQPVPFQPVPFQPVPFSRGAVCADMVAAIHNAANATTLNPFNVFMIHPLLVRTCHPSLRRRFDLLADASRIGVALRSTPILQG